MPAMAHGPVIVVVAVVADGVVIASSPPINPELAGERRRLVVCEACIAPKRPGQAKAVVGWPRLVAHAAQSWQAVSPLLLATNMAWGFVGEVPSDAAAIITVMARGLSLAALFGGSDGGRDMETDDGAVDSAERIVRGTPIDVDVPSRQKVSSPETTRPGQRKS
ncbi:hypothetical protein EDB85DRAFT_1901866, partial [Lactarius pseudohatsudake]